jgi:hypothetical protein
MQPDDRQPTTPGATLAIAPSAQSTAAGAREGKTMTVSVFGLSILPLPKKGRLTTRVT